MFNTRVSFVSSPCSSEASDSSSSKSSASSFCDRPTVHLSDGMVLEADMIVGADGQHSTVRLSVEETRVEPKPTDTIAFTGSVPMRKILEDDILNQESIAYSWVYWLGPRRCFMGESSLSIGRSPVIHHVLGYPIVSHEKARGMSEQD
jgi:hypothetical protein